MSLRACGLAVVGAISLFATPVRAEEVAPSPTPVLATKTPAAYPIAPTGGTGQLTMYLALMIVLLGGGFYVMRNGFAFLKPKAKGPRKLEISETRMLGNRQFLIVAEYESRKMLIGVCPGRIDYLCTLSGTEPEFPQIPEEER